MLPSKSLRWSGAAISNGRQRLSTNPASAQLVGLGTIHTTVGALTDQNQYSLTTSRASLWNRCRSRSQQRPIPRSLAGQVRSISLWGWISSNSNQADFGKVHTPQSSSAPDAALGHDGQILVQQASPSPRSIPAVHQTSDLPPLDSISLDQEPAPSSMTASPWEQPAGMPGSSPAVDPFDPAEAFATIPERIGYLKEVCGLDFGWGSSSMMEMLLEHIHIYGAVSWTTSVILLATFVRLAIFFPVLRSSDMAARIKATQPIVRPVRERMVAASKAKDYGKLAEARAEWDVLKKEYNIKASRMMGPLLAQIPLQFGAFRLLRNMGELPVPALKQENWLWTQDLTLGDPLFILPVANAVMIYLTIKRGGEMGTSQIQGGLMVSLSYILPFFSFVFVMSQPGTVQLYFTVSAILAFVQSRLLTNASFRHSLGLHPLVPTPGNPTPGVSKTAASSRNATMTQTPVALGPGGLKLYQPPRPRSSTTTPTPAALPAAAKANDAGIIDRFVDKAKSQKAAAVDGVYNLMGTSKEKRIKEVQSRKADELADRYEKRMARQDDSRRQERNRDKMARIEMEGMRDAGFDARVRGEDAPRGKRRERR